MLFRNIARQPMFMANVVASHRRQMMMNKSTVARCTGFVHNNNNTTDNQQQQHKQQQQQQQQKQQQIRSFASSIEPTEKTAERNSPTLDIAKALPRGFEEMDNNTLITCAAMQIHEARIEVLKRHIMAVDEVDYDKAGQTYEIIAQANRQGMFLASLPYKLGIAAAVGGAVISIPMVFDLNTAIWFNQDYVTTDVPEPRDLETSLEVGSWTWNWMEPPLGTFSFVLLCLQYSRSQMVNLGIHPYTDTLKQRRGNYLAEQFPQYDADILKLFSATDPLVK